MKAYNTPIRKYYKYGNTINATIVGSPTVANGIVSGFSSSNYLTLPQAFSTTMPWEMVFKIKLNSDDEGCIMGRTENRYWNSRLICAGGAIGVYLTNNTSEWSICSFTTEPIMELNTWYWVKFTFTGTSYNIYLSTDGINYTLEATEDNSTAYTSDFNILGYGNDKNTSTYYFAGEIDFKKSYIKINDKEIWHGTFVEEATEQDYDFYKDTSTIKIPFYEDDDTYYALKSWEKGQIFLSNFYNGWVQPILTSNNSYGTISSSITTWSDSPTWKLSDGNYSGTKWGGDSGSGIITWQLPESIKMFSCRIYQTNESSYLDRFPSSINIYGSNNGTSWTLIGSASGYSRPASASYVVVNCSASDFYSYYKWDFGTSYGGSQIAVGELVIIATLN